MFTNKVYVNIRLDNLHCFSSFLYARAFFVFYIALLKFCYGRATLKTTFGGYILNCVDCLFLRIKSKIFFDKIRAVKRLAIIPRQSVTAKPLMGPVPN